VLRNQSTIISARMMVLTRCRNTLARSTPDREVVEVRPVVFGQLEQERVIRGPERRALDRTPPHRGG